MEQNKLKRIRDFGQSVWLDFFDRKIMDSGELQKMIDEDGVRGVTSNPAIFEKAISASADYDEDVKRLSQEKNSPDEIFFALAIKDIQRAADIFKPVYEESAGEDGFVSLEVSPRLARDTEGTIKQAKELWKAVDRKNGMIKIPGTAEALPAIRQCIGEGINVNVTILFGLPRYREVVEAYISGLEDRVKSNLPIANVASVASFFLSRIDVMVDPVLTAKGSDNLKGEAAIASAKMAYKIYREVFYSERFKNLEAQGAKRQRLLWASTGTKDPSVSDVKYVEALIGKETVNTIPIETLNAFRDHGSAENRLEDDMDKAAHVLKQLKDLGINIDAITQKLEDEGIEKFNQPYDKLLKAIEQKRPTPKENQHVFGVYGLGTMGRNLLLNMADHGFAVAGYNRHADKVDLLMKESKGVAVQGFTKLPEFIGSLKSPKTILLLVTAGKPVDDVITEILPLLQKGDIIIDGGNSYFTDTTRRGKDLEEKGIHFFGMGVSGGEEGARKGPSMMPGGDEQAYQFVKPVLEKIAAQVNGEPCVTYLGPGASGHFVKMVHNGIEYALMQLIAETYEILKKGLRLDNEAIYDIFKQWNEGRLQSFLLEVTRDVFAFKNSGADHLLLDDIKDEAKAKGTGKWTSQIAMDLQAPIPVIDIAVSMRDLSKYKSLRTQIAALYDEKTSDLPLTGNTNEYLIKLEQAFYFSMVTSYAQGMHLLFKASQAYEYHLQLDQVAKIWRGGCIIRAAFLEDMYNAYKQNANLEHLFTDKTIQSLLQESLPGMREIVSGALMNGLAVPAYAATLSYFDTISSARMPSNLIQAQRDYFGAHTYELLGKEGVFHTDWMNSSK